VKHQKNPDSKKEGNFFRYRSIRLLLLRTTHQQLLTSTHKTSHIVVYIAMTLLPALLLLARLSAGHVVLAQANDDLTHIVVIGTFAMRLISNRSETWSGYSFALCSSCSNTDLVLCGEFFPRQYIITVDLGHSLFAAYDFIALHIPRLLLFEYESTPYRHMFPFIVCILKNRQCGACIDIPGCRFDLDSMLLHEGR
jgi:hypothetical protein